MKYDKFIKDHLKGNPDFIEDCIPFVQNYLRSISDLTKLAQKLGYKKSSYCYPAPNDLKSVYCLGVIPVLPINHKFVIMSIIALYFCASLLLTSHTILRRVMISLFIVSYSSPLVFFTIASNFFFKSSSSKVLSIATI